MRNTSQSVRISTHRSAKRWVRPHWTFSVRTRPPGPSKSGSGGMGDLQPELGSLLNGLTFVFLLVCLLLGTSPTAAEYAHRTMGTWLTFEPRRTLVFFSKISAVALVVVPVILVMTGLVVVGMFAVFAFNALPTSLEAAQWESLVWRGPPLVLLASAAAAIGAALGTLLRRTSIVFGRGLDLYVGRRRPGQRTSALIDTGPDRFSRQRVRTERLVVVLLSL